MEKAPVLSKEEMRQLRQQKDPNCEYRLTPNSVLSFSVRRRCKVQQRSELEIADVHAKLKQSIGWAQQARCDSIGVSSAPVALQSGRGAQQRQQALRSPQRQRRQAKNGGRTTTNSSSSSSRSSPAKRPGPRAESRLLVRRRSRMQPRRTSLRPWTSSTQRPQNQLQVRLDPQLPSQQLSCAPTRVGRAAVPQAGLS